jgi:hypothetical protein
VARSPESYNTAPCGGVAVRNKKYHFEHFIASGDAFGHQRDDTPSQVQI